MHLHVPCLTHLQAPSCQLPGSSRSTSNKFEPPNLKARLCKTDRILEVNMVRTCDVSVLERLPQVNAWDIDISALAETKVPMWPGSTMRHCSTHHQSCCFLRRRLTTSILDNLDLPSCNYKKIQRPVIQ